MNFSSLLGHRPRRNQGVDADAVLAVNFISFFRNSITKRERACTQGCRNKIYLSTIADLISIKKRVNKKRLQNPLTRTHTKTQIHCKIQTLSKANNRPALGVALTALFKICTGLALEPAGNIFFLSLRARRTGDFSFHARVVSKNNKKIQRKGSGVR